MLIFTSARSIQAQISRLLPNYEKYWRIYRPNGPPQMKNRLVQLKKARVQQKAKYSTSADQSATEDHEISDPLIEYIPAGIPSHIFLYGLNGNVSSSTKQTPTSLPSLSDDSLFSDKEVVINTSHGTDKYVGPDSGSTHEIDRCGDTTIIPGQEVKAPLGRTP